MAQLGDRDLPIGPPAIPLRLTATFSGTTTYRGNNFGSGGCSQTGGAADYRNNTKGVFLPNGPASLTIRVLAANINSDGVPNYGDTTDQDFAIVCYNCSTDCEPNRIPDHYESPRACCRPDPYNDCIVTTQQCCAAVGGLFKATQLTCARTLCPMYGPSLEP